MYVYIYIYIYIYIYHVYSFTTVVVRIKATGQHVVLRHRLKGHLFCPKVDLFSS